MWSESPRALTRNCLNKREPRIGTMIAELKPRHRTRAYRYIHEGKSYCVWYLRLRDTINRSNNYADIIKIEMYMPDDKVMPTTLINVLSAHLINEAYPVLLWQRILDGPTISISTCYRTLL